MKSLLIEPIPIVRIPAFAGRTMVGNPFKVVTPTFVGVTAWSTEFNLMYNTRRPEAGTPMVEKKGGEISITV
jgi:hypothetical protein